MIKVDITFKMEFTLVAYSKDYYNRFRDNRREIVEVDEILNDERDSMRSVGLEELINQEYNFSTKWYKDIIMKNYDEKFIRGQDSLETLFDRIEHSKNVKDIKREIINELLGNKSFLIYIGEKEKKGITLDSYEIPARKVNSLAIKFRKYSDYGHQYGGWDVIPKVIDYEIEYK